MVDPPHGKVSAPTIAIVSAWLWRTGFSESWNCFCGPSISKQKAGYLNDANIELEVLRFQVRLATDLGAMPVKSHGHAAEAMQQIRAQIGGWLASKAGGACDDMAGCGRR